MSVKDVLALLELPAPCARCSKIIVDDDDSALVGDPEDNERTILLCRSCVAKLPS